MIMLYGLARCDTCRKARAWLDAEGIAHRFVDYRDEPLAAAELQAYAAQLGWEKLVNRASTTWRQLPEAKRSPDSEREWLALVQEHPTLVRRPLLVLENGTAVVGFSADRYAEIFR